MRDGVFRCSVCNTFHDINTGDQIGAYFFCDPCLEAKHSLSDLRHIIEKTKLIPYEKRNDKSGTKA